MTPRELGEAALAALKCPDDALAPEPDWFLCTEPNDGHSMHIARGEGNAILARWARGTGRAAGELRKRLGLPPYRGTI